MIKTIVILNVHKAANRVRKKWIRSINLDFYCNGSFHYICIQGVTGGKGQISGGCSLC